MKTRLIEICFVDDQLPKNQLFEKIDDAKLISSKTLNRFLSKEVDWGEESDLREMLSMVLRSRYRNKLSIHWAMAPNICLNAIRKKNYNPDIVIYDWDYGYGPIGAVTPLIDMLKFTNAFFFIYTNQAQRIPIVLYKNKLDEYAHRSQLLPKGGAKNIYTSEEFIYQYIVSLVSKKPIVKIGKIEVKFDMSGWLKSPTDILYLESILGRQKILDKISIKKEVSENEINKWLSEIELPLYINKNKDLLFINNSNELKNKYGSLDKISASLVFKKFGIRKLNELLEREIIGVKY